MKNYKSRAPRRPRPFPSQHASAFGHDKYGYWQTLVISAVDVCFRWVVPGNFTMGSPEGEIGRYENEGQHDVTLSSGFWLAETPCTQTLWQAVVGTNPSDFEGAENPVENISWQDVDTDFLPTLAKIMIDFCPRFPTEAEWEYSCRAGADSAFSFGESLDHSQSRYTEIWDSESIDELDRAHRQLKKNDRYGTCSVNNFEPNRWGFSQMHGNVYEWCSDWLGDYSVHAVTDPQVLANPTGEDKRTLRGGSWRHIGRNLRSASRDGELPAYRLNVIGFRLALSPVSSGERSD